MQLDTEDHRLTVRERHLLRQIATRLEAKPRRQVPEHYQRELERGDAAHGAGLTSFPEGNRCNPNAITLRGENAFYIQSRPLTECNDPFGCRPNGGVTISMLKFSRCLYHFIFPVFRQRRRKSTNL